MPRQLSRAFVRGGVLVALAATVPLAPLGCGTDRPGVREDAGNEVAPSGIAGLVVYDQSSLAGLAQRERKSPAEPVPDFAPRWAGFAVEAPLRAEQRDAGSPAVRKLHEWLNSLPARSELPPTEPAGINSIRLYASGRLQIAEGKYAEAMKDLAEASRLNPSAAAPLRELALAQAALGQRASSMSTLRIAVERGLTDPQSLWLLGRDELRQRRHTEAAALFGRAYLETADRPRSELHRLVAADLSEALRQEGLLVASRELLAIASTAGAPTASNSIYRAESMELDRRAGDLWTNRGDLAMALGMPDAAFMDYSRGLSETTSDPVGVVLKMAVAHVRAGRPATAAHLLVDTIARSGGAAEDRQIRALAELAGSPAIADALVRDVAALAKGRSVGPRASGRLVRAIASGLAPARATKLLKERLATNPDDLATLGALLDTYGVDDAAARAATLRWYVGQFPMQASDAASTAMTLGRDTAGLARAMSGATASSDVLLRSALMALMGREADAIESLKRSDFSAGMLAARDLLLTRIAAGRGDWATVREALNRLDETGASTNDGQPFALMMAMASAQRFGAAADAAERWLSAKDVGATASECLVAAALMADAGRFRSAVELNQRAMSIDPSDERAYAGLSAITGPDGPAVDSAVFVATGRAARMNVPGSGVIRYYQFRDLFARRQMAQAEAVLRSTIDPLNESAGLLDTLADVWRAIGDPASKLDPKVLVEARVWMESMRAGREDSPELTLAYARLLLAMNEPEAAERVLAMAAERLPIARLQTALADVLIGPLRRPSEGRALLDPLLSAQPRSIDHALLWAGIAASMGRWQEAAATVEEIPREAELTPPQVTDLLGVIARRAVKANEPLSGADSAAVASILDRAFASRIAFDLPLHALRLDALCGMEQPDAARIARAIGDAGTTPETFRAAMGETLNLLGKRGDLRTGIDVTAAVTAGMSKPDPALVGVWLQMVVQNGTFEDAEKFVRAFEDAAPFRDLLNQFTNRLNPVPTTEAGLRGEIAFAIANDWSALGREPDAFAMFRLALTLDPKHGWAANNLGYGLLEAEGPTEEATAWIELAAKLLPDEASVIDSLAWLRFKQGRFVDQPGDDSMRSAGSISLLKRAISLPGGEANADLFDHLGDAFERTGQRAEARAAWRQAAQLLSIDMARARTMNADPRLVAGLLETSRAVRNKIDAARDDARPNDVHEPAPAEPVQPH